MKPAKPAIVLKPTSQPKYMHPLLVGPGADVYRAPPKFGKAANLGAIHTKPK